jgi:hypothetical protein
VLKELQALISDAESGSSSSIQQNAAQSLYKTLAGLGSTQT